MVGQAAALYAGPAVMVSLCLSGACCFLYALCYCELASFIPEGGSAYSYSREAFGLYVAWFVAWNLILEYVFGAAAIAIGWSGYFCSVLRNLGIIVPDSVTTAALAFPDGGGIELSQSFGNLLAVLITVLCTCVLAVGIEESARVNNAVVGIKISVLLLFILAGAWHVDPSNYEPFLPDNTGKYGEYGLSGVFRASSVMLFAYIGFDAVSTCAAEAVCPERTVPLGILGRPPAPGRPPPRPLVGPAPPPSRRLPASPPRAPPLLHTQFRVPQAATVVIPNTHTFNTTSRLAPAPGAHTRKSSQGLTSKRTKAPMPRARACAHGIARHPISRLPAAASRIRKWGGGPEPVQGGSGGGERAPGWRASPRAVGVMSAPHRWPLAA